MPRRKSSRRTRVRRNKDGTLNKKDLAHNAAISEKYMFKDNPWMDEVLKEKNPTEYDKYLKYLIKSQLLKKRKSKRRKSKRRKSKRKSPKRKSPKRRSKRKKMRVQGLNYHGTTGDELLKRCKAGKIDACLHLCKREQQLKNEWKKAAENCEEQNVDLKHLLYTGFQVRARKLGARTAILQLKHALDISWNKMHRITGIFKSKNIRKNNKKKKKSYSEPRYLSYMS